MICFYDVIYVLLILLACHIWLCCVVSLINVLSWSIFVGGGVDVEDFSIQYV